MKINFSLPYKAHWGEMLCVNLTFYSSRGASQEVKLLMSTRDGYHWMVETSTRENRQHPFDLIYYYYTVVDEDGKVLRTESVDSPRVYVYDSSKSYIFDDFWLEEKLAARKATAIGRTPEVDVESYERMNVCRFSARPSSSRFMLPVCTKVKRLPYWAIILRWATGTSTISCR